MKNLKITIAMTVVTAGTAMILAPVNGEAVTVAQTSATGSNPSTLSPYWGIIERNTYGNPSATLRNGPWTRIGAIPAPANGQPPYGTGSLEFIVGGTGQKIVYGNEALFANKTLASLYTMKYQVYTGMDTPTSLPNLDIEVDPHLVSLPTKHYTTLVSVPPAASGSDVWQKVDATKPGNGNRWWATGLVGTTIGCTQGTPCSFAQLKAKLPAAVIGTIAVAYGSTGGTSTFIGAIDGLQIGGTVYNFEANGVFTTKP